MRQPSTLTKTEWPPNYVDVWAWRQRQILLMRNDPAMVRGAIEFYKTHPAEFINHWLDTYDPRNAGRKTPAKMPFIMFEKQDQMVEFLLAMTKEEEGGLIEKARDMGATWVACAFSVWLWRFYDGASIGWGSRKEQLVDKIGDPDSIFEKIRMLIRGMPKVFWPKGFNPKEHMAYMRIVNPESDATITGEAGDSIGRGGRKLIYFKDESAHYERPEKIEAALADNTRVQIDISSVNGLGNVFHRRREAGVVWTGGPAHKGVTNVFVMDWSDHPTKDQAWYDARKKKAIADGLKHVFAQEVDRNYSAAVHGVIIEADWILAAIDADKKLGFKIEGQLAAGLDVADEGGDLNALAARRGPGLLSVEGWGEGDTGQTARKAIGAMQLYGTIELQYDCIGVGAGIKSEANRLGELGQLPKGLTLIPWSAAASPQFAEEHLDPDDDKTPTNKDFFENLKSQSWWNLARRFEKTFRAINEGIEYDPDELISLPSSLPNLQQLKKELGQAVMKRSLKSMKLMVDKAPEGTKSPNLADAVVMAFNPMVDDTPAVMMVLRKRSR